MLRRLNLARVGRPPIDAPYTSGLIGPHIFNALGVLGSHVDIFVHLYLAAVV